MRIYPEADFKIDGAGCEFIDEDFGQGIGLDFFEGCDRFGDDLAGTGDISFVVDADHDGAAQVAGGGVVGNAGLKDFLIGDVDHPAIVGFERGGAELNLGDGAFVAVDDDLISDMERASGEENDAGDVVAEYVFEAKADSDAGEAERAEHGGKVYAPNAEGDNAACNPDGTVA